MLWFFRRALLLRFVRLLFGLSDDSVGRRTRDGEAGLAMGVDRAIGMVTALGLSLLFFLGHGDAAYELDETVAVALGWDWGDLRAVTGHAFPEMLGALDEAVLRYCEPNSAHTDSDCGGLHVSSNQ